MNLTFEIYLKLFGCSMISVALSVIIYILDTKKNLFRNVNNTAKQIIIGLLFGCVAIMGTEFGVPIPGSVVNARDAAPLCAGLLFGGPAGIIAGVIGGVWRWFAVYWGAGAYSQIACSVSTAFAGFYAAFLRSFVFDKKRPTVPMAFATGAVMEIFHMTTLFITHISDSEHAFETVRITTAPMAICNSIGVGVSTLIIAALSSGVHKGTVKRRSISQRFQIPILIAFALAFISSTVLVYSLQSYTAQVNTESAFTLNISDVKQEISDASDRKYLTESFDNITKNRHIGSTGRLIIFNRDFVIVSGVATPENISDIVREFVISGEQKKLLDFKSGNDKFFCYIDNCEGYYIVPVMSHDEVYETRNSMTYINSFLEIIIYAVLLIMIYLIINKVVVSKINTINKKLNKIINGNLDTVVDVHSTEEFSSLSNDINHTVDTLKKYIEEAESRIDRELALAKNIQHSVLPSVFPPFPDRKDFDIYASMDTAKEVGGDFYDFYLLDSNHLAILIADVSGKGIPAAMFMMNAKTAIKSLAETGAPIEEVFTKANAKLCEGNDADMFVTAWMGIVNLENGHVDFVNAGHNPPLIYRKGACFDYLKSRAGLVLAGMDGLKYKRQEFEIKPGDKIFLYTDGVTEATNNKELYGEDRLQTWFNKNTDKNVTDSINGVRKDVDAFVGEAEQFDDITMLMLEYKGNEVDKSEVQNI